MPGQSREDPRHLRRSLPFSEDDFWHPCTQRPVMIHLGESQVFERHVAHANHGVVGGEFAPSNILEELANGFSVQNRHSAVGFGIQPDDA